MHHISGRRHYSKETLVRLLSKDSKNFIATYWSGVNPGDGCFNAGVNLVTHEAFYAGWGGGLEVVMARIVIHAVVIACVALCWLLTLILIFQGGDHFLYRLGTLPFMTFLQGLAGVCVERHADIDLNLK